MNVKEVYEFMIKERLAVLSTVTDSGQPQAALMGMAVTPPLKIIFDTVKSSRKYPNLKKNPRVAWVVGCTTEVSVQYEGLAEESAGEELAKYKKIYFAAFPHFRTDPYGRAGRALPILLCGQRGSGSAITNQRVRGLRSGNFRRCGLTERRERQTGCGRKSGGEPPHSRAH